MAYLLILINLGLFVLIIASGLNIESHRYKGLRVLLLTLIVFNYYIYIAPTSINHFDAIHSDLAIRAESSFGDTTYHQMTEKDTETLTVYLQDYVMRKSYKQSYSGSNWIGFDLFSYDDYKHNSLSINTDTRQARLNSFSGSYVYVFKVTPEFRDYVKSLNQKYLDIDEVGKGLVNLSYTIEENMLIGQFTVDKHAEILDLVLKSTSKYNKNNNYILYKKSGGYITFESYLSPAEEGTNRQLLLVYAVNNQLFQQIVNID